MTGIRALASTYIHTNIHTHTHTNTQVLSTAEAIVIAPSWHVRAAVLPLLQTIIFRHQFVVSEADMVRAQQLVVKLLRDSQVEVLCLLHIHEYMCVLCLMCM